MVLGECGVAEREGVGSRESGAWWGVVRRNSVERRFLSITPGFGSKWKVIRAAKWGNDREMQWSCSVGAVNNFPRGLEVWKETEIAWRCALARKGIVNLQATGWRGVGRPAHKGRKILARGRPTVGQVVRGRETRAQPSVARLAHNQSAGSETRAQQRNMPALKWLNLSAGV